MAVNVNVRFGDEDEHIHQAVKVAAAEDRRSFNAEVLWLLERGLQTRMLATHPDAQEDT